MAEMRRRREDLPLRFTDPAILEFVGYRYPMTAGALALARVRHETPSIEGVVVGLRHVEDGGSPALLARFPDRGLVATRPLETLRPWADDLDVKVNTRPVLLERAMVWSVPDVEVVPAPIDAEEWTFWTVIPKEKS